jgi:hypothetical protein
LKAVSGLRSPGFDTVCRDGITENFTWGESLYAPRVGRQALEDYCTEALAWCLSKSPEFLIRFLKLTRIPTSPDWAGPADVHIQVRFTGTDSDDTGDNPVGGRFDLVIESVRATVF